MAAIVDYGTNAEFGMYGLFNDFYCRITTDSVGIFKLKYRIRLTETDLEGDVFTFDVDPINEVSIINPFEVLKSAYFKTEVVGGGGINLDDATANDYFPKSSSRFLVEVGEIYATAANLPATFQGYDAANDKEVTLYNGYENILIADDSAAYANYLDPLWETGSTVKLPVTIKDRKILTGDQNKIFFATRVNRVDGGVTIYDADEIVTDEYDAAGNLIGSTTEPYTGPNNYYFRSLRFLETPPATGYYEQYVNYTNGTDTISSEKVTTRLFKCNRNPRYRLRWFNRYNGPEYLNCNGKFEEDRRFDRGKEILTDAVNYEATTFGTIKSPASPELKSSGIEKTVTYSLYTNYLTEEEQLGFVEIYESPNVIMFDPDNNIIPVLVNSISVNIESIKDNLIQYRIELKSANRGKTTRQ